MLAIESFGAAFPDIYMDANLKVSLIGLVIVRRLISYQGMVRLHVVAEFVVFGRAVVWCLTRF